MKWKNRAIDQLRAVLENSPTPKIATLDPEDIFQLSLRKAMAECRLAIRKRAGARGGNRQQRLSAHRFAKDRARSLKKRFDVARHWAVPKHDLFRQRTPSLILDRLDPRRVSDWKPIVSRRFRRTPLHVKITNLNFLDAPVHTLKELQKLSAAEREEVSAFVDFEDTHCVDVGAYLVLAEFWPQMSKIFRGGRMSLPVQKVLSAIQLDRELSIGLHAVRDHKDVWAFPIRHRRPRGSTTSKTAQLQPQEREEVADQLCDLVNDWLDVAYQEDREGQKAAWELTPEGKSLLATMTGELLDNAERHSMPGSSDGDWSTTAFMAARSGPNGKRELRCFLAFLSTGQSMAESMANAPTELLDKTKGYLAHRRPGKLTEETLLTVLALQDAITSDANARKHGRGGTGLQDVLSFVGQLGAADHPNADVRVTIVSGASCIRLRHPNLIGHRDNNGRRVQWCNHQNDPNHPPHPEFAFDLPAHLAGTLVSVGFTLDPNLFVVDNDESDDSGN